MRLPTDISAQAPPDSKSKLPNGVAIAIGHTCKSVTDSIEHDGKQTDFTIHEAVMKALDAGYKATEIDIAAKTQVGYHPKLRGLEYYRQIMSFSDVEKKIKDGNGIVVCHNDKYLAFCKGKCVDANSGTTFTYTQKSDFDTRNYDPISIVLFEEIP
jgi:hypothetical protein